MSGERSPEREYLFRQTLRGDDRTAVESELCEMLASALDTVEDQQIEIARLSALLTIAEAEGFHLPEPISVRTCGSHTAADDRIDGLTHEEEGQS